MDILGLTLYIGTCALGFWILNKILGITNNRNTKGQFKRKVKVGGMEDGYIYL